MSCLLGSRCYVDVGKCHVCWTAPVLNNHLIISCTDGLNGRLTNQQHHLVAQRTLGSIAPNEKKQIKLVQSWCNFLPKFVIFLGKGAPLFGEPPCNELMYISWFHLLGSLPSFRSSQHQQQVFNKTASIQMSSDQKPLWHSSHKDSVMKVGRAVRLYPVQTKKTSKNHREN